MSHQNDNGLTTATTSHRDDDPERLNFDEIDALNNDFEEESDESEEEAAVNTRVHMTTAERMDKLFNDIGGLGRFQAFAYFAITYGISAPGFFFYILGYLIQQPVYECTYTGEEPQEKICTAANICDSDPRIASWEVAWDAELSLINWQGKLDLMCAKPWKVGFIGSAFFLGWVTTILWLPRLSDMYGRKKFFAAGMAANLLLYTMLLTCQSLDAMIFIMFSFGMMASVRVNVGYVYLMELMPKNKQTLVGTLWNVGEAMIYFIATIYFWKVSKNWYFIVLVGYAMQMFSFFGSLLLPESPRLLVELNRIDEAKLNLDIIARWNKKHLSFYLNDFLQTPRSNSQRADFPDDHKLEIAGMPNDIDEKKLRQFLSEHIGSNNDKILSVVLSNEPGHISQSDLTKCFVSFEDEKSMLQSIEDLRGIGYQGYQLTVQKRKPQVRMPALNTPGMLQRNNGENSGPIFLTHTPKNFEAATRESQKQAGPNSLSYYLGQRKIQINLLIMCFIWLSTSFNFYLIQFLINTFDQVYESALGSATSEVLAYAFAGLLYQLAGIKASLFLSFGIAFGGGFAILAYGLKNQQSVIFPILVLVSKFGIACAFNIIYVSHSTVFPIAFAATALGFCNFFARLFSAGSPVLAQIEEPLPMIAFTFTSVTACVLALGIQTGTTPKQPSEPNKEQMNKRRQQQLKKKQKKGKYED